MASSYQQKFPVPDGFPELLHDLMKAIVREQPADLVEYSYQFFKNMSQGIGEPQAERKNYYGDQIQKQKDSGKAQVIDKPHTRGQSAKSDVKTIKSEGTHQTVTTNKTNKIVGGDYVADLTGQAIQIFEDDYVAD